MYQIKWFLLFLIFSTMLFTQNNEIFSGKITKNKSETTHMGVENVAQTDSSGLLLKNGFKSITFNSTDIEKLPIRNLEELLKFQSGVVLQDDNVYVRGGLPSQTGYYINGFSALSPFNNNQMIRIIPQAVEQMSLSPGYFSAKYGGAASGMVMYDLKTGGNVFKSTVDFYSDKFVGEGEKLLGTYSYRHQNFVATVGGPLLDNRIKYYVAWENRNLGDNMVRFSEGFDVKNLEDKSMFNTDTDGLLFDLHYPDGFTPDQQFRENTINGNILFDYSPATAKINFAYQRTEDQLSDTPMLDILNERKLWGHDKKLWLATEMNYDFSSNVSAKVHLSIYRSNTDIEDDYFGNGWTKWRDSAAVAEHTNKEVIYMSDHYPGNPYVLGGIDFARNGYPGSNWYSKSQENYMGGGIDFSSLFKEHQINAGIDIKQYTMRRYSVKTTIMNFYPSGFNINDIEEGMWEQFLGSNYGYDQYGEEYSKSKDFGRYSILEGPKKPMFMGLYFEGTFIINDFNISTGIRFDYYKTDEINIDENFIYNLYNDSTSVNSYNKVSPYKFLSPRINIDRKLGNNSIFYANYGRFIQSAELGTSYLNGIAPILYYRSQINLPANTGQKPHSTNLFEIGFKQKFNEKNLMEIAGFYKITDNRDEKKFQKDYLDHYDEIGEPPTFRNVIGSKTTSKGIELSVKNRYKKIMTNTFNYTYMNTNDFNNYRDDWYGYPSQLTPVLNKHNHHGSFNLDLHFGKNEGGMFFKNSGINLLFRFNNGKSFTFVDPIAPGWVTLYELGIGYMLEPGNRYGANELYDDSTPWNKYVDLKIDKTIKVLNKASLTFYVLINNLFNWQNIYNIYPKTGEADDDGMFAEYGSDYGWLYEEDMIYLYNKINIANSQAYWDVLGKQVYGHPRQIVFGIKLSY